MYELYIHEAHTAICMCASCVDSRACREQSMQHTHTLLPTLGPYLAALAAARARFAARPFAALTFLAMTGSLGS